MKSINTAKKKSKKRKNEKIKQAYTAMNQKINL